MTALHDNTFRAIAELMHTSIGLSFAAHKKPLVASRLAPRLLREAIARHVDARTVLQAGPAAWRALGFDPANDEALLRPAASARELDWLAAPGHHLILFGSAD